LASSGGIFDVARIGKARRHSIGFIPQEPSDLLYCQSVQIECDQADRDNELAAGTTFSVLQELVPGISGNTHPRDLSEGQRLGLALSVVVSSNPTVLILDEPTRGLDYEAKSQLTRILIQFAATFGKAVVLATHDVELVAELATRCYGSNVGAVVDLPSKRFSFYITDMKTRKKDLPFESIGIAPKVELNIFEKDWINQVMGIIKSKK